MEKRLQGLEEEITKLRAERETAEKSADAYILFRLKAVLKTLSRDNLALKTEIQSLLHNDQTSFIAELVHKAAALAEVFSAQSLLLSQCSQEAAVAKLETIDLAETLRGISQDIGKRHKGGKEARERSGSSDTKCEDSRPTLDCSFDQRASWGDARDLASEEQEKQAEMSFVIQEEEEAPDPPYRLETDTSLVDTLQSADDSVLTVVQTEPALPISPASPFAKKTLSKLARIKNKETTAVQQSFKRRSSTLWRMN